MKPKYGTIETYEFIAKSDFLDTIEGEFFSDDEIAQAVDKSIKVNWFIRLIEEPELLFCMN